MIVVDQYAVAVADSRLRDRDLMIGDRGIGGLSMEVGGSARLVAAVEVVDRGWRGDGMPRVVRRVDLGKRLWGGV